MIRVHEKCITHPHLDLLYNEPGDGFRLSPIRKEHLPRWSRRLHKSFIHPPQVQPPVLQDFLSSRCCEAHSASTDRGDQEEEEDREAKDELVARSGRLPSVSTPLKVCRNSEEDEEDS